MFSLQTVVQLVHPGVLHSVKSSKISIHSFKSSPQFKAPRTNLMTSVIPGCPIHHKLIPAKYRE